MVQKEAHRFDVPALANGTPKLGATRVQSTTRLACVLSIYRELRACPFAVQYRLLAVPHNDFERHPRLVSC